MSKNQYSAKEAAVLLLEKIKTKAIDSLAKSEKEDVKKSSPENKTSAQMAELKIDQPMPPKANQKLIPSKENKEPMKLKKFLDGKSQKRSTGSEQHPRFPQADEGPKSHPKSNSVSSESKTHGNSSKAGKLPEKWRKNGS